MSSSRRVLVALLAPVALALAACGPAPQVRSARDAAVQIQGGGSCVTLLAGQTLDVGTVCTSIAGDFLEVTYATTTGWSLYQAHLWAGTTSMGYPQEGPGNPKIGNFPYKAEDLGGASTHTFQVPLSVFGLTASDTSCDPVTGYLAAHAVVRSAAGAEETAWGEGYPLDGSSWAMGFGVDLYCSGEEGPLPVCGETAFARLVDPNEVGTAPDATCFRDTPLELSSNRWGWYNGPLASEATYAFDLYAGAGRCEAERGTKVGTLSVVYAGGTAVVAYAMLPGFTLDETHLYVGPAPMPTREDVYTVAPGQYGLLHDLTAGVSDTFTVEGLSGPIYVIAHANACAAAWE